MATQDYDVVIIGAGLAGLTVGTILACQEKRKVLILERENFVGGRIVSFMGQDGDFFLYGKKLGLNGFKKALSSVNTWVTHAEPDLETIMEKHLLDGYSFEAGGHATFWGRHGRVGCLLDYLGISLDLPGNEGFTVIDPDQEGVFPVERGGAYDWMSKESNRTAKALLREMLIADEATLDKWDRISFDQWLNERTQDRKVYEFLAAVASIHMVMGEPKMIPAGDFIRFMNTAGKIGMNLISGSTGIVPKPGFVKIAEKMAEKITSCGGEVITGAEVNEVVLENKKVTGIRAGTPEGEKTFSADMAVCTVPIKKIWQFLPKSVLPESLVKKVDQEFFSVGMLTGLLGVNYDVFGEAGMNPKSWLLVPAIIKAEEGYIGDVDIISIMPSNFAPSLSPEGKYSLAYSIALTEGELRDKKKVDRVINAARQLFHRRFPPLKDNTLWEIWTCSDKGFGDWPPVGERRPATTLPGLENLFFAGDGYGENNWGSGMDAAIYSGLLCVDTITQDDYAKKVLPEYHR
ncbi:MAG: FAD-dependent oxidoreductase [Desulfobacteraceae bacterium]|nr:FAD-dependent oxidoreductase [Desulfobacteraceae bacterium]MCF8037567.1 FAD-dependent oxidoreductase [Desulfobacteraceae bacterium]